jgi:hypothetical protein
MDFIPLQRIVILYYIHCDVKFSIKYKFDMNIPPYPTKGSSFNVLNNTMNNTYHTFPNILNSLKEVELYYKIGFLILYGPTIEWLHLHLLGSYSFTPFKHFNIIFIHFILFRLFYRTVTLLTYHYYIQHFILIYIQLGRYTTHNYD